MRGIARQIPNLWLFLRGKIDRQALKEVILSHFIGGTLQSDLLEAGRRFADYEIDSMLSKEALKRLQWHLARGDRALLVTAAIDLYVPFWGERAGFEAVICSRMEVDSEGCVTGRLVGRNCWGEEKVRRFLEYMGGEPWKELYVYGDSEGDRPLLELATHPYYRSFE